MRLDSNLTARQLWLIAADAEHRDPDLLDQIVDHPAAYRALSDWAVAALAEEDVRAVAPPPEPEEEPAPQRRGLRLPSVGFPRVRRTSPDDGDGAAEGDDVEDASGVTGDAALSGSAPGRADDVAATAAPVHEDDDSGGMGAWLAAAPVSQASAAASAAPAEATQAADSSSAVAEPAGSGNGSRRTSVKRGSGISGWMMRPAPVGAIVVLAVVELLTLLALGVVASNEPAVTDAPAVPSGVPAVRPTLTDESSAPTSTPTGLPPILQTDAPSAPATESATSAPTTGRE